jgi:hypothetical protein
MTYIKKTILIAICIVLFIFIIKMNFFKSEKDCIYVSSYGIMKSCDIYSDVPQSSTTTLQGYDFSKGFDNCSIYICSSAIPEFIKRLDEINYRFKLITGDADETCPVDLFKSNDEFIKVIGMDKIIHLYAQNCIGTHPKLSQIPIGLDYHTLSNNQAHRWGERQLPIKQEQQLISIKQNSLPFWKRELKCYSNFHFSIDGNKFAHDRRDAINSITKELVYYEPTKLKRIDSWKNMATYTFVLSPHGNGIDCHRTWEALCIGSIPIVKTSKLDTLYTDLPVLIVEKWSDITIGLLQKTIDSYRTKKFNYDKLRLKYWIDL